MGILSRRRFLAGSGAAGLGLAAFSVKGALAAASVAPGASPPAVDVGVVKDGKVSFPAHGAPTEAPDGGPPNPFAPDRRVGFAVVALGKLSLDQILPAFGESKKCKLTALVSGTPDKMKAIAHQYGIADSHCYDYAGFDKIKDNPDVEVVYIVLPNAMHREFVIRAAQAGKHVLCEKPMAMSSAEAREMIKACSDAGRKLMIAYRMQYEPHCREIMRLLKAGEIGKPVAIDTVNVQAAGDARQWRLNKALSGGGSLPDIGLYCLNTSRALLGEEPVEVSATMFSETQDERFASVEDRIAFTLRFPSGVIANCFTAYSAHKKRDLTLLGTDGWARMDSAYDYEGQVLKIARLNGKIEDISERQVARKNQFALEMDHMAQCVLENRVPRTPGEEGLQDQVLMEAIYEAARSGKRVTLTPASKPDATRGPALSEGE